MINVSEIFGENVFNLDVMREKLPKDVFRSLKKTIDEGKPLDSSIAGAVAHAMKEWAISKGATHYTHWFQPMTRRHCRKARQLYLAHAGRQGDHGIFGQRARGRGTGCLLLPQRRRARHL